VTPTLINTLHAVETLAAHHRRLANNSIGATREYHLDAAERSLIEIENIRRQIAADGGVTPENQATAVHQRHVATAQWRCAQRSDSHDSSHESKTRLPRMDAPGAAASRRRHASLTFKARRTRALGQFRHDRRRGRGG
jgi:hypothetical protein